MYRIYKYGFYILYYWWETKHGKSEWPAHNSLLGYSLLLFVNLLSVPFILQAITRIDILIMIPHLSNISSVALAFTIWGVNYFALVRNGKYKAIVREFEPRDQQAQKKTIIEAWLYIIGSFLILFISAFAVYLRERLGF